LKVKAKVQLKLNIHVGAFIEISPKGFTLRIKVEIGKILFNLPQILIYANLYRFVLAPRLKLRIPSNLGGQFVTLWDQCSNIY